MRGRILLPPHRGIQFGIRSPQRETKPKVRSATASMSKTNTTKLTRPAPLRSSSTSPSSEYRRENR